MRFFGTFRGVLRYVSTFSHYFLVYLKKKQYLCAKLPNKSAPNYRTNKRQITEFSNITLNINHL